MSGYDDIRMKIARGWNTWNTRSVLSHVLLPEGFAVNFGLKEYMQGDYLKETLIGRSGDNCENVQPGLHAYDGSYTELSVEWKGIRTIVQTAVKDGELVVLVTALENQMQPAALVIEAGMLWNCEGYVTRDEDSLTGVLPGKTINIYTTGKLKNDPYIGTQTPYLAIILNDEVGISAGRKRTLREIKAVINEMKAAHMKEAEKYGELAEAYRAMQCCLAWDTVYDPLKKRVITPVSRIWNMGSGGYVLFCWDTYFAAQMAAIGNKELAYANAIEITREKTENGFVPNFTTASGSKSRDRSQPPVGSMAIMELYRKYGDKWLLEELFDDLLTWNRWYAENRQIEEGLLAWGSNEYIPVYGNYWETHHVHDTHGGALESGLDNSPMYDGIPFNDGKNCMELADVGLTSLYIADCNELAEIAHIIGKKSEVEELKVRSRLFTESLKKLWSEEEGIFLNKHTDSGKPSKRLSPTLFYPMLAGAASEAQAQRMIKDHFYNPEEFWGEWIMPSIARNDPAYPDQDYWRGRIWAPINYLVYLGLRRYGLKQAQKDMKEKSVALLLKEWLAYGHVHENYCGDTGEGCNKNNSDKFYHWGGLLALIALIEDGYAS